MSRRHELVYALNAGSVDPEAVTRIDLEKMRMAGEHPVLNLLPKVLGPGTLRPGTQSLFRIPDDAPTKQVAFLREVGESYILLLSAGEMRVTLDGAIQQVPNVATRIVPAAWSNASTAPATATGGATLTLRSTKTALAKLRQAVTVAPADQARVNILRVVVERGPVFLRFGTTAGGDDLMSDAELDQGVHKIGLTPNTGTLHIEVRSTAPVDRIVSQVEFEAAFGTGDLVLPTPWDTFEKVESVRRFDSIDVMFCGGGGVQQRRIEHRGPLSWGICLYKSDNGPFVGGSDRITMTPAALTGNTTITASEATFKPGHTGALIEVSQTSKMVTETLTGVDQVTDYVTIIGVDAGRYFHITGAGASFLGTIVLERSFDPGEPISWTTFETYVDTAATFARIQKDDTLDNLTVHYRFRITAYTSGTATMTLEYEAGAQTGRGRITSVTSPTVAQIETYVPFGNTSSSRTWRIGDWSDVRGWPRVPVIQDGRMHWFRGDEDSASKPDDYPNYDDTIEGDAQPFTRTVGTGRNSDVLWALSHGRLVVGTALAEAVIQASELDEPLTATAYTVRKPSSRGCADIQPAEHDDGFFFVQRSRRRLYEMSIPDGSNRLRSQDISRLNPAAYRPGIKRIEVQQQPDTRCHAVLDNGQTAILTYERDDKVVAITNADVGGIIEDIEVMPDTDQDDVYLIVNRGGKRYQERYAPEAEQASPATCTLLDAHKVLTGSVSQITGGDHLAGQTVQVWADGARRPDVTLDSLGAAPLGASYARVVYGLAYKAKFKSVKLAYAAQLGTAVGQTKMVHGAGMVLSNSCLDGIRIGPDDERLDPMPDYVNGALRTPSQFFAHYDADVTPINSDWNADARFYFEIDSAEGPCTLHGIVLDVETRDGVQAQAGG